MAGIRFNDYFLNELSYKINLNFNDETNEINVTPEVELGITVFKSSSEIITNLKLTLGNLETEDAAFMICSDLVGRFSFDMEEIESYNIQFETFIKETTISILWSFIRPHISDLIVRGNRFPNYILPVVNVSNLVADNELNISYDD